MMKGKPITTVAVWSAMVLAIGGAFFAAMSMSMALASPPAAKDGKAVFRGEKCQECHTLKALNIKKEADPDAEEVDAPDLSAVGAKRTPQWISKWLTKQETIDGKKHEKKFKSSAEELSTVSEWLAEQKGVKK